uniref:Zinc finger AN1-type containing 1 n=1 Tax=Aquila chrysaetos chrysaetos TaxID=223781 RepID=A0A663E3F8_AQUCH
RHRPAPRRRRAVSSSGPTALARPVPAASLPTQPTPPSAPSFARRGKWRSWSWGSTAGWRVAASSHRSRDAHGCSEVNIKNNSVKPDQHRSYPCSYKDCNRKELLPVLCPYCEKHFCLRHRHQSDHECEKLDTPKPRMAATQQLVKQITGKYSGIYILQFLQKTIF